MRTTIAAGLVLAAALPAAAQTIDVYQEPARVQQQLQQHPWVMTIPAPVSGTAYAIVGDEEQSNYLRAGITAGGGYVRNLYAQTGTNSINDGIYLVQPTIALDRTSTRSHLMMEYDPSFTWYRPTAINEINHSVKADMNLRLSPYVSLRVGQTFARTSSVFGQVNPSFQAPVSGTTAYVNPGVFGLYSPQITNQTDAGLTWQFGRNSMVAGSGWLTLTNYTDASKAQGMFNTDTRGGSGAFIQRVAPRQYLGGMYQYTTTQAHAAVVTTPGKSELQTNNFFGFYTFYPRPNISVSVQGGGQYYILTQHPFYPDYQKWAPAGTGSIAWQGEHTGLALSYSRLATAGQGVLDGFTTDAAVLSGKWQVARHWTFGIDGAYSMISNLVPITWPNALQRGHTISAGATLEHRFTTNLALRGNYARIHQSYGNIHIPAITTTPDTDRVLISLSYQLSRPIGR